ncbi:hypothetical protein DXC27_10130 [Ruminococcus sp. OM08-7]|jgi:hypothetical protein|nr:hypothetical protein DXC27_10130 [Ruminococcus sp. OM08-7]
MPFDIFSIFLYFFHNDYNFKKRFGEKEKKGMTRISKKKYDAIVKAKNAIADFDLNNRNLEFVDSAVDVIQAVALAKLGALEKTALLAVFTSATLTNNGFRMPPTAAVVSNFKKVSKDMKRHTLSVFVDDPLDPRADEDGYFTMPLF